MSTRERRSGERYDQTVSRREKQGGRRRRRGNVFGNVILILLIVLVAAAIVFVFLDIDEIMERFRSLRGGTEYTITKAQELADVYDYDSALALIQGDKRYSSDTQLQDKAMEYEAAKEAMEGAVDAALEAARERTWEFDYQGAADVLKSNQYYNASKILKSKAAEYEEAETRSGESDRAALGEARTLAAMYDYDGAISRIQQIEDYQDNPILSDSVAEFEAEKAACVPINPEEVMHIFYHSLVVDPSRAFNINDPDYAGWQQWMTTISEFDKVTQSMYERGYVLVSIHDLVTKTVAQDGTVTLTPNQIMLPEGKKAYVLSLDDLSYYHTYDDHGVANKIVLDAEGKPTCEYFDADGNVLYGDYDAVPRMDTFLEEHPDACYRGARGIIALTGYNGILGYRTDGTYSDEHNTDKETYYADEQQIAWLAEHPDFDFEKECEEAKKVAEAMKADGWEFASHTWGHKAVGDGLSYEKLVADTERWLQYVSPLIGETDTIIFAHGEDISPTGSYDSSNDKYNYLKSKGFDIYCNVDSISYMANVTPEYMHQGRLNIDGYRIYHDYISDEPLTAALFDAAEVIDPERPLPVPDLNGESSGDDESYDDGGDEYSGDEYSEY